MDQKIRFEIFGSDVDFGWGVLDNLGIHAKALNKSKALIVTDAGLMAIGIPERVRTILEKSGVQAVMYTGVENDPKDKDVLKGAKTFKDAGCDLLIGLGGGSAMDASKGVRIMCCHEGEIQRYFGLEFRITNPMPPHILIPTTSGTGSETSLGAMITESRTKRKMVMMQGPATISLVDPELTVGLNSKLTAQTGMDALSHHLEAYFSPRFHPAAEGIAMEGLRLIGSSLFRTFKNGKDEEARIEMAMASTLGALAFRKGLGAAHSMAHALNALYPIHHGLACSICMPYVMEFNKVQIEDKLVHAASILRPNNNRGESAIEIIRGLSKAMGLPHCLKDVGVDRSDLKKLAELAMMDVSHKRGNPRRCGRNDMLCLFEEAF